MTYNVQDDRRLKKVFKKLKAFGVPLQYSVFRCRLGDRARERMLFELKGIMKPEDDLLVVGLCGDCVGRLRRANPKAEWAEQSPHMFEVV